MDKLCKCGETMRIRLRTVIYQNKAEIENVPIYSCENCNRTMVYPGVKDELTNFIGKLGNKSEKQQYFFNEMNEVSHLMHKVSDKTRLHDSIESIIEERINELLDLLLLAQSLEDEQWIGDIRKRLSQITNYAISTCDFT